METLLTLQDCKERIATEANWSDWDSLLRFIKKSDDPADLIEHWFNKAHNLFASQFSSSKKWIRSSDQLPEENVSVLVFIPEEDNHITVGMWDVSKKWVLLDEYRVPLSEVTYWSEMIEEPEDKTYSPLRVKVKDGIREEDTTTYQIRELQKQVYELQKLNEKFVDLHISETVPSPSSSLEVVEKPDFEKLGDTVFKNYYNNPEDELRATIYAQGYEQCWKDYIEKNTVKEKEAFDAGFKRGLSEKKQA
jgi:hypothetical protein